MANLASKDLANDRSAEQAEQLSVWLLPDRARQPLLASHRSLTVPWLAFSVQDSSARQRTYSKRGRGTDRAGPVAG